MDGAIHRAGHQGVGAAQYRGDLNVAGPVERVKAARAVVDGRLRDRIGWVGDVDYLDGVIPSAGHQGVGTARYGGHLYVAGPVKRIKATLIIYNAGILDWSGRDGHVDYLDGVIPSAGHQGVDAARYLDYLDIVCPIQRIETAALRLIKDGGRWEWGCWVGDVDYLDGVIPYAGDHRIGSVRYAGYLDIACPVERLKAFLAVEDGGRWNR